MSAEKSPLGVTLKQAFPQHFGASRVRPNKVGERRSRRSGVERKARIPISARGVIADGNKSAVDGVGRSGGRRNSISAEDRPTAEVRIDDTRTSLSARGVVFPRVRHVLEKRTCFPARTFFPFRFSSQAAPIELHFSGPERNWKKIPDRKHGGPFS